MTNIPVVMSLTRQHTHLKLALRTNVPLKTTQQAWHRALANYVGTVKQTQIHHTLGYIVFCFLLLYFEL